MPEAARRCGSRPGTLAQIALDRLQDFQVVVNGKDGGFRHGSDILYSPRFPWAERSLYPWGFILQLLALVHFFRRRPDGFWFFVILFFGALGALIYFVAEVVPDFDLLRAQFRRAARRRRLKELEAIVEENGAVGNLEELADLSFDEGQFARARELYHKLLKAWRPTSVDPFYRRGLSALALGDASAAVANLKKVVASEPKYDFYRATGMLASAYTLAGAAQAGRSTVSESDGHFNSVRDVPQLRHFSRRREASGQGAAVGPAHSRQEEDDAQVRATGGAAVVSEGQGAPQETRLSRQAGSIFKAPGTTNLSGPPRPNWRSL